MTLIVRTEYYWNNNKVEKNTQSTIPTIAWHSICSLRCEGWVLEKLRIMPNRVEDSYSTKQYLSPTNET